MEGLYCRGPWGRVPKCDVDSCIAAGYARVVRGWYHGHWWYVRSWRRSYC